MKLLGGLIRQCKCLVHRRDSVSAGFLSSCFFFSVFNPHPRICVIFFFFFLRERDIKVREKHQLVAPCTRCDWGLNSQLFGAQDNTPTN